MKWLALALSLFATSALAQQPPWAKSTTNVSTTVAVTDTFQSLFSSTPGRASCTVQNNSASNNMWVFFGPIASATKPTSVVLTPGQAVYCTVGGVVLTDQVSVTGTSGDAFYAAQQ